MYTEPSINDCGKCKHIANKECGKEYLLRKSSSSGQTRKKKDDRCGEMKKNGTNSDKRTKQ